MQLIFHDASHVSPAAAATEAMLTIERKGNFSLSIGAVAALKLVPKEQVVLAQDVETNSWYLILEALAGQKPFVLKPRDTNNSRALMFCGAQRARAYYEAHGLREERSVRARIGLEPVQYEKLSLFPLVPQHSTKTPAALALVATPIVEASGLTEPTTQPDVVPLDTDLPHLQPEQPAAPAMTASSPAPVSNVPVLAPGQLPESRGEQLADYWNERDISKATPVELEEVLKVLGAMPRADRGFTENKVLNQAKTEQAKRTKEAGKKGGNRG
jgi:hypothetical protein